MEVLAISFFFVFTLSFIVLALNYHSRWLYFFSGMLLILWGYLLLTSGLTETTMQGKTNTQTFTNFFNTSTNTSVITSIATTEAYTYVQDKNDYTNGFGVAGILLGIAFAIVPVLSEISGGRVSL
jgi:cytochrome c biogenesis protein CcdA